MSGNTQAANVSLIDPGRGGPTEADEDERCQQTLGKGVIGQAAVRDTSPCPLCGGLLEKRPPIPPPSDPDDDCDPNPGPGPDCAGCVPSALL